MLGEFAGLRVIENDALTETETTVVPRTWRERLWSWPWHPWGRTRLEARQVPSEQVYLLNDNVVVMHPAIAQRLRATVGAARSGPP